MPVLTVQEGSPAHAAGVRPGQCIAALNGSPTLTSDALLNALDRLSPGDVARVAVEAADGVPASVFEVQVRARELDAEFSSLQRLQRIAAGSLQHGDEALLESLGAFSSEPDPLIRGHLSNSRQIRNGDTGNLMSAEPLADAGVDASEPTRTGGNDLTLPNTPARTSARSGDARRGSNTAEGASHTASRCATRPRLFVSILGSDISPRCTHPHVYPLLCLDPSPPWLGHTRLRAFRARGVAWSRPRQHRRAMRRATREIRGAGKRGRGGNEAKQPPTPTRRARRRARKAWSRVRR